MTMAHYGKLIYLFSPVILAGIFNMVFVKLPVLNFLRSPMDRGWRLPDGKRLFGDNKTWKGFWGMVVLTILFTVFQELGYRIVPSIARITLMPFDLTNSFVVGVTLGLGYALAELPNSLIKRRFDVEPGKNVSGLRGLVFGIFDQADSVIGCTIALAIIYPLTISDAAFLLAFGTGLHYVLNVLLYMVGLKKQAA